MKPDALLAIARAEVTGMPVKLRSGGADVGAAQRDEMLAKIKAGAYVELEIDVLAYEQETGTRNRNSVRFRDGAMVALGRTGKGKPFLRDHEQYDSNAVAGVILDSRTEKRDEGSYALYLTARLTAPWAVEMALRGLLSTVSIGWFPTGAIECSACKATVLTKCFHWPGDKLTESTDSDGNPVRVRDRNGTIVVEWIYTAAELIECSVVPVPAVPGAHIEDIRAALAAQHPEFRALMAPDGDGFPSAKDTEMKTILAALVASLSLAPTAGEDEAIKAVEALKRDRDTLATKLEIAEGERTRLATVVEANREVERKHGEDKFVADALASGQIAIADEPVWRKLFKLDESGAKADMAKRTPGCATPVGQPRQSAAEPADPKPAEKPATEVKKALADHGATPDMAIELARKFGAKTPEKSIGRVLGIVKEA